MRRGAWHTVQRQLGNLFIDGLFQAGASAWRRLPSARPERHSVRVVRDIAYAQDGNPAHRLDVYAPAAPAGEALPAVLYVHGGGFRVLSKESHFMMATAFAKAGYVVFNMSYRLAPQHPFPAAVEDVATAYGWVVGHAASWGADPRRIVVAGESAGANLAVCAAIMATYERDEPYARRVYQCGVAPKAVVAFCGVLQVSDPRRSRGRRFPDLVQDRIDAVAEWYLGDDTTPSPARALADPIVVLETAAPSRPFPPTFASVGTLDPLVEDTLRLERVLAAHGVSCEARIYERQPHAFQAMTFRASVRKHWDDVFAFLDRTV